MKFLVSIALLMLITSSFGSGKSDKGEINEKNQAITQAMPMHYSSKVHLILLF